MTANPLQSTQIVAQGNAFSIEALAGESSVLIRPTGVINEDVNMNSVLQFLEKMQPQPATVVFDMGQISRINSCGVREWLLFMQRIQLLYRCSFSRANESFVEAAGAVPTVFGKPWLEVAELEAPFFCARCKKRFTFYLKTAECFHDGAVHLPERLCSICQSALEFDGMKDEYFAFLKSGGR